MGWIPNAAVAGAVVASLACMAQRVARVPAWPLLLWLLAAQAVPRSWALASFVGAAGCLATGYAVLPHSLFMGGIQLDVLQVLEDSDAPMRSHSHEFHSARTHA